MSGTHAMARPPTASSVSPSASQAALRTAGRASSPRATWSATARETVCSTGRKSSTEMRNIPAHNAPTAPYTSGPSERAATTLNAYASTPDASVPIERRAASRRSTAWSRSRGAAGAATALIASAWLTPLRRQPS